MDSLIKNGLQCRELSRRCDKVRIVEFLSEIEESTDVGVVDFLLMRYSRVEVVENFVEQQVRHGPVLRNQIGSKSLERDQPLAVRQHERIVGRPFVVNVVPRQFKLRRRAKLRSGNETDD